MRRKNNLNKLYSARDDLTRKARDIPLVDVLAFLDATIDPHDPKRWDTSIGPISIHESKYFCWTRQCGGGGSIDFVMLLLDLNFNEAREWLTSRFTMEEKIQPKIIRKPPLQPPIPQASPKNLLHVTDYLVQQRRLLEKDLKPLIDKGVLYADHRQNVVFVLLGKEKSLVGAELRGTGPTRYRGLFKGSKRTQGFFYAGPENAKYCIVCESAIDAISCQILFPGWLSISTSGVWAYPPYLPKLLSRGIQVFCGFDNDEAGHLNAERMIGLHSSVIRMVPAGKDWNSDLR
jgi:hypothetical protein